MSLRITGGTWRSRLLERPDAGVTRPMPDQVKQAIFNMLGHWYGCPGELPPLKVADVFSGGGSMGLEALSRGADCCTFYEKARTALAALQQNIAALGAEDRSSISKGDAWIDAARDIRAQHFDLVFLDPPYRDTQKLDRGSKMDCFLGDSARDGGFETTQRLPLVVLHHDAKVHLPVQDESAPWRVWKSRVLGSNAITFLADRRDFAESPATPDAENRSNDVESS